MAPEPSRSALAPLFWRDETGLLPAAVHLYLNERGKMTLGAIALIRAYFRQWIGSGVWDANPHADDESRRQVRRLREDVDRIVTVDGITRWLRDAEDAGVDPL